MMMSQSFRLRFRAMIDYMRLRFRVIFAYMRLQGVSSANGANIAVFGIVKYLLCKILRLAASRG